MTDAPKTIWAEHQTCTVDGSGPVRLLAMDREFSRGTQYTRTDTITPPDSLIRAALYTATGVCAEKARVNPHYYGQYRNAAHAIRALADDPEAIAAIIKAAEGRG